jgi:hypothetical protein
VVFIGESFVVGLLSSPEILNVPSVEEVCKSLSTKEIKSRQQDKVKFDPKEKGKKPIETKGIVFFSVTGQDLNLDKLSEHLRGLGAVELV